VTLDLVEQGTAPVQPPLAAGRRAGEEQNPFRRKVRISAIALLILNIALGLFARQQQHVVLDYTLDVYDTAFISTNYVHLAQVAFQHYVDRRLSPEPAAESLQAVLDNLDVAIEKADSPGSRAAAQEARAAIVTLGGMRRDAEAIEPRIADIQHKLEDLGSRASGVGLKARDNIEAFSSASDTLLSLSVGTVVVMVGVARARRLARA
jgi:hypothetical protein